MTVQPDACITSEAAERWRLRHERAARPAGWDTTASSVVQPGAVGAYDPARVLHPAWRAWIGGVGAGATCAGVAYCVLQRHGFYVSQAKRRMDRVSILVLSFTMPFMMMVSFSKARERAAERDTLHTR